MNWTKREMLMQRLPEAADILALVPITGVGTDGKNIYKNRTISAIAPTLTDADALAVGKGFADLQRHGLSMVTRTDSAVLED